MSDFKPPLLLRNHHLQTIVASTGPRKMLLRHRARAFIRQSLLHTLDCGEGVRLQGMYCASAAPSRGLVIMIHGWLGHSDSLYLLSAGNALYQQGYDIFRLNLRDHGNSCHLNKELFHSVRIREVLNAVRAIQQQFPHPHNYLCGFSLGGNFSLRIAAKAPAHNIKLDRVAAICPVIDPVKSNRSLHDGLFIYHDYFRNKWQRSLRQKLHYYPEHNYGPRLRQLKTLNAMNDYFVPNHTHFQSVEDYLRGYAIDGELLARLDMPCHIISSEDDPMIAAADIAALARHHNLHIELTQYGGHCGYIENYTLSSWVDRQLLRLFAN